MRPNIIRWLDLCMPSSSSSCAPCSRRNRSTSAGGIGLPVRALPELSPIFHHSPGQLQDMSTVAAPKRQKRRKFQSKLSFFGPKSINTSSSPSNMRENLPELSALLTTLPEAAEGERRGDGAGNTTEPPFSGRFSKGELLTTPVPILTDKCKARASSYSPKPSGRNQCEETASDVAENATGFIKEEEVTLDVKPESKALSESDLVVRKVREDLQEKGPAKEDDLCEGLLCPSPAHLLLEGTLTAFLDRWPEFRVVHEVLYSLAYYQDPEDHNCGPSFHVQDGAATGSCLAPSNDSGRQHFVSVDGGPRRARVSPSSTSSCESVMDGEVEEQEKLRMKDGWSQVPSPPLCRSRALQALQKTNAEVPHPAMRHCPLVRRDGVYATDARRRNRAAESQRPINLRECRAREGVSSPCRGPEAARGPAAPRRSASKSKKTKQTAMEEQKPTTKEGAGAQDSARPRQPRTRQHQRSIHHLVLRLRRRRNRARFLRNRRSGQRPQFTSPGGQPSGGRYLELHDLHGHNEQAAAFPCSDVESTWSSHGGSPPKCKLGQPISIIVQMVKKEQRNYTDQETRGRDEHAIGTGRLLLD
ncbi:hypothetical protein HPB49_022720 [Dermacentor silvarum]|uniref:Uncharacterized protein n=1 Tax=Dermacentor silvarum TaxID=543639 RepID=A0ACB8CT78_DERSI|nr:hypothetical protein HPB49_022720 [Dermacentor silvarum]